MPTFLMKLLTPIILLFLHSFKSYGQDDKIEKTDSSIIRTKYFEYLNSIRVFNELKNKKKTYYKDFYFTTKKIKEEGTFTNDEATGLWKYYSTKGKLEKTINYTTGKKKYFIKPRDAYDNIFINAQARAKAIIIEHFGKSVAERYVRWNPNNSYYYGSYNQSGRWFDVPDFKPIQFLFRYDILLDKEHKYPVIEFTLDNQGKILNSHNVLGLTNRNLAHNSFITREQAIKTGKTNGLSLKENNTIFYLKWVKPVNKSVIEGDYEIIVAEYKSKTTAGNQTTFYYDAIAINPWTGNFIAKRRLRRFTAVHAYSASSTGFIEY